MSNFRVLTVTTSKARIDNLISAYKEHIPEVPPNVFLFTDRQGITGGDLLSLAWMNGAGKPFSLLP